MVWQRAVAVFALSLSCSSAGKVDRRDSLSGSPSDSTVDDAPGSIPSDGALPPLPVDPTGECLLMSDFARGTFLLTPQDMDADVSLELNQPSMIIVNGDEAPFDPLVIQDAADRLSIRPWPDGADIPVTKRIEGPSSFGKRTTISLQAKTKVPDGWYVLRIADPPSGFTRFPAWDVHHYGARGLETRFHTGSYPTLSWVRICNRGAGAMTLRIEFSANVMWPGDISKLFSLSQTGASPSCTTRDARGPGEKDHLQMECTGLSDEGVITLAVRDGLIGLDGASVTPRTYSFTLRTLPQIGAGLVVYQADPPS